MLQLFDIYLEQLKEYISKSNSNSGYIFHYLKKASLIKATGKEFRNVLKISNLFFNERFITTM